MKNHKKLPMCLKLAKELSISLRISSSETNSDSSIVPRFSERLWQRSYPKMIKALGPTLRQCAFPQRTFGKQRFGHKTTKNMWILQWSPGFIRYEILVFRRVKATLEGSHYGSWKLSDQCEDSAERTSAKLAYCQQYVQGWQRCLNMRMESEVEWFKGDLTE